MNTIDVTPDIVEPGTEARLEREKARAVLEQALQAPPACRIPSSTYRIQFNEQFTFEDLRRRIPYLRRLGVGDLYTSPYFYARSPHGYDVNDHNRVHPALGGEEKFAALLEALAQHEMGHIMDVVPNHMGIVGADNAWWYNVLENGPSSPYAMFFDIDWRPLKREMRNQVLLPVLGDQYGQILERGELRLEIQEGALFLSYWDSVFPIAPCTYTPVLELALEVLRETAKEEEALIELESILTAISHLPDRTERDPELIQERQREKEVIKRRIDSLMADSAAARAALEQAVASFNGTPGDPRSFDRLDELISNQAYRLSFWRVAAEEINYRRFFDINELAAIRMELPQVFRESHRLVMRLVGEGRVTGLRIDHPDGLWNPAGYFSALQIAATVARARRLLEEEMGELNTADLFLLEGVAESMAEEITRTRPLYVVAEKIVSHGEKLPTDWAVHGTTGYEFLNSLGGLFISGASEQAMTEIYERFIGQRVNYNDLVYAAKLRILHTSLASELNVMAHALNRISEQNRRYRDFTLGSLTHALREVIAAFPVYRTYITEGTETIDERDRAVIEEAIRLARRRSPNLATSIFDFLRSLLLLEIPDSDPQERIMQREFIMKLQQLTGPLMAKGLEDTTFYIYNRLVALNEVGGEPHQFGTSPAAFHRQNIDRYRSWPHTMLATSTHDTKRSEDVRARIALLSELPQEWGETIARWSEMNHDKKREGENWFMPSRNDEYLLYQVLLGAWPLEPMDDAARGAFADRVVAYMIKAARESKIHTSWINENQEYEEALEGFTRAILNDPAFLEAFAPLQAKVARYGALNSLAQVTLKYASPGVPDLYQGNETWDFSLVDPDNRRPVDYEGLDARLQTLQERAAREPLEALVDELLREWRDGRIKLWVTHRVLAHRRAHPELYRDGDYLPLKPGGAAAEHVVAFARTLGERAVIAAAPRLVATLNGGADRPVLGSQRWVGTTIEAPAGRYRNLFTGEQVESDGHLALDRLFHSFPVALLERERDE